MMYSPLCTVGVWQLWADMIVNSLYDASSKSIQNLMNTPDLTDTLKADWLGGIMNKSIWCAIVGGIVKGLFGYYCRYKLLSRHKYKFQALMVSR